MTFTIIMNYVGIIVLFFLIYQLKQLALSHFRYKLFEVRHEIFLLALEYKNFGYNNEFYRELETNINTLIRFAHRIGYTETLIFSLWFRFKYPTIIKVTKFSQKKEEFFERSKDKKLNKEVEEKLYKINKIIFSYLIMTSPLFILVTLLKILMFIIVKCYKRNKNILKAIKNFMRNDFNNQVASKIYYQNENCVTC